MRLSGIVLATTFLSGCAAINQQKDLTHFNNSINKGDYKSAYSYALNQSGFQPNKTQVNNLLWGLQAGMTLSQTGQYKLSNDILDSTELLMRSEDTEGKTETIAETTGSILVNDAALDYEQTHYDGVMANTIKAWNFVALDDYSNARVEFNRAEERQRRAVNYFKAQISEQKKQSNDAEVNKYVNKTINAKQTKIALQRAGIVTGKWEPYSGYVNPFTTYSYALNLIINGKSKSDFKQAEQALKRVYSMTKSPMVKKDLLLASSLAKGKLSARNDKVWVIFENGQSMIREEKRLDLPMFMFSDNISYAGMALPRLKERGIAYPSIQVNGKATSIVSDMDRIISAEFDKQFPLILGREVTRMLVKAAGEKALDEKDELLGIAATAYSLATTQADIRSFSALPSQYQVAQIDKTSNELTIQFGNKSETIQLDPNAKRHIAYVKLTNKLSTPLINIINL